MNKKPMSHLILLLCLLACAVMLAACSDDDGDDPAAPAGGDETTTTFVVDDFAQNMRDVLPPEYVALAAKVEDQDPWKDGDHPLLGKVIGSEQELDNPTSIYYTVAYVEFYQSCVAQVMAAEEATGTVTVTPPQGWEFEVAYERIAEPMTATIPEGCRTQFGVDSLAMDGSIVLSGTLDIPDFPQPVTMALQVGWAESDGQQDLLVFLDMAGRSTSLTWSRREASDTDAAPFRVIAADWGVEPERQETYGHWHTLNGLAEGGFVYNMAWYANQEQDGEIFFCVNGSGDSDVEFGLRGQQMSAADGFASIDTNYGPFERIFAPILDDPYADVTETSERGIGDYIATEAMFGYGDLCTEAIASPFPTR